MNVIARLASYGSKNQSSQPAKQSKKRQKSQTEKSLSQTLLDFYEQSQDLLTRTAICYNHGHVLRKISS